jgi:hypothetical protein
LAYHRPTAFRTDVRLLDADVFETDLAIGEELAGPDSSFWIPVEIYPPQVGENGNPGLSVKIGKTIMPVKTYARPKINFNSQSLPACSAPFEEPWLIVTLLPGTLQLRARLTGAGGPVYSQRSFLLPLITTRSFLADTSF